MTAEEFLEQLGVPKKELQNLPWFDYGNLLTWLEDYSEIKNKQIKINTMENLKLAIAAIETQLDEVRNALKQLEEQPQQPVNTNWYDFTEEQMENLGRIVKSFIDNVIVRDLGSTDVHLRENGIEVSIEVDLSSIVEDEIPYGIDNMFTNYLNDEITEQREEQQQDC